MRKDELTSSTKSLWGAEDARRPNRERLLGLVAGVVASELFDPLVERLAGLLELVLVEIQAQEDLLEVQPSMRLCVLHRIRRIVQFDENPLLARIEEARGVPLGLAVRDLTLVVLVRHEMPNYSVLLVVVRWVSRGSPQESSYIL